MKSKELDILKAFLKKTLLTNVTVYELKSISPFFDYSIVCDATNNRLAKSVVDNLRDEAEKNNLVVRGYSKEDNSTWFYIDLNSIIVHIFLGNARREYNLDGLYFGLPKEALE